MMLDALYYPHDEDAFKDEFEENEFLNWWYRNGGDITHRYLKRIRKTLRAEIFEFLDQLPTDVRITVGSENYILAHAAPTELFEKLGEDSGFEDEKTFAVWYRFRSREDYPCEETVIFGHTLTYHFQEKRSPMEIWYGKGLIGIDCGASCPEGKDPWFGRSGRLACLRLDDMKEFYSEELEIEDEEDGSEDSMSEEIV